MCPAYGKGKKFQRQLREVCQYKTLTSKEHEGQVMRRIHKKNSLNYFRLFSRLAVFAKNVLISGGYASGFQMTAE